MPEWTDEDQELARQIQQGAGVEPTGLVNEVTPLTGPSASIPAANDCGDVSWKVPMGRLWFPSNIPNVTFHHWSAGAALATDIAHKGGIAGAQALAATLIDCLTDKSLIDAAKTTLLKRSRR